MAYKKQLKDIFWVNPELEKVKTKCDFLERLNSVEDIPEVVVRRSPYEQFVLVSAALIAGTDVILAEPSIVGDEGQQPVGAEDRSTSVDLSIGSWDQMIEMIRAASDSDWKLGLFTSGTTGSPDQVWQSARKLTRTIRTSSRFADHRWGFCYEPTHMAGLQVFFQAISNGNQMVYLFESDSETLGSMIRTHELTHLSATPTFYRLRALRLSEQYRSVQRVTSGGEPFDSLTMEKLREVFPEAEVRNIYALTETGTLFESNTELFEVPQEIADSIKISDANELLIHESLTCDDDLENISKDGWFHTGDVVEVCGERKIRFKGRKSENVNIAGYQVNILRVEREIVKIDKKVSDALVKVRNNSVVGNVLVSKIVVNNVDSEKKFKSEIRDKMEEQLPSYKVPKRYEIVDEIEKTRSGKKKRQI